jgi:hypothetical protein
MVIDPDVEGERTKVFRIHTAIRLKPEAAAEELIAELWWLFP